MPDQHELVELCRRRAEALRELINLHGCLTRADLTTGKQIEADQSAVAPTIQIPPPDWPKDHNPAGAIVGDSFALSAPEVTRRSHQHIAALLAEVIQPTAQIDPMDDEIDPTNAG
jgi:hypothetical protein